MGRWAGWGAGPAGAGSAGGPSRLFLAAVLAGCIVVTVILAMDRHWLQALLTLGAAGYFGLRLFGKIGPRREE